jgi:outer membrane protein TolC
MRRAVRVAVPIAALAAAACDSPYQRQGILSDDVAHRLSTMEPGELARMGEAGPLAASVIAPPTPEELAALQPGQRALEVDLAAVRAATLENNLGIKVVRIDPAIANERVLRERAKFEWTFGLGAEGGRNVNFAPPLQAEIWNAEVRPNLNIPLADGGQLDVDWRLMYFDDQFPSLVPEDGNGYQSVPRVSLNQPLLRGGGRLVNESSILLAEFGQRRVEVRTRLMVHRLLADAERAYWRAFGARRAFDIAVESYRRAVEQVSVAERLSQSRMAAATEVIKARYLAVSQVDDVIAASELFRARSRELKQAMNRGDLPLDDSVVLSFGSPPEDRQYSFVAQSVLDTALRQRSDMMEAELAIAESTLGIQVAQNGLLPRLDAFGTAAPVGFGQSLGGAVSDTGADASTVFSFNGGIRLEIPLGNEAAKADLRMALYRRLKELATGQDRRQTITREVFDAVSRTGTGWQAMVSTRQAVDLATRAYDGVRTLYERRFATITDLTQSLLQLAEAQRAQAAAEVGYQIALLDLSDAAGLLPGRAGLSIESDIPLPAPEAGDPGADPEAFLDVPPLLEAERTTPGASTAPGVGSSNQAAVSGASR